MKYQHILPDRPSFANLQRQARSVKSAHRIQDSNVAKLIDHFDTSIQRKSAAEFFKHRFSILDVQRLVARQYGFSS